MQRVSDRTVYVSCQKENEIKKGCSRSSIGQEETENILGISEGREM